MRRPSVRAASLVEALLAAAVLALVAAAIYSTMTASLRTTGLDRVHEARRHVLHDLLERFGHDGSDLRALWPAGEATYARTFTVAEALGAIGCAASERPVLEASLAAGQVTGFTLVWTPGVQAGAGQPERAVRLDRLYGLTALSPQASGPAVASFRMFVARSRP